MNERAVTATPETLALRAANRRRLSLRAVTRHRAVWGTLVWVLVSVVALLLRWFWNADRPAGPQYGGKVSW